MKTELEKLASESKTLKTEYLRSLAEFDNFRRRKEKEFGDFRENANERLLAELIPILENFDRALAAAQAECEAGSDGVKRGIVLISRQLKETLAKFGLKEFSCVGQEFDPRKCEAISSVETEEQPENTVVAETGKGYMYGSRVLRPALVIVAKAKSKEAEGPSS